MSQLASPEDVKMRWLVLYPNREYPPEAGTPQYNIMALHPTMLHLSQ